MLPVLIVHEDQEKQSNDPPYASCFLSYNTQKTQLLLPPQHPSLPTEMVVPEGDQQ